ncbi:hypothetical protein FFLO_00093 [Filobasidium floriforme]|uniref:asparagine--tRNA ligase n=1 Tax=Filobasidium floriforme TaxID=5210 RepID=A0A8K0NTX4_9TREE|nr:hypothetical protein FFLO_00093 [Filobasidium floriforme]
MQATISRSTRLGIPRTIRAVLDEPSSSITTVQGWLRSIRAHKNVSFLEISDGSSSRNLQAVVKGSPMKDLEGLALGSSLVLKGEMKESRGDQPHELSVHTIEVTGESSAAYPIQKKYVPPDVLRDHAHLRFRTTKNGALARLRDAVMREWHDHFEKEEYVHIHTPIMTSSDCEGAGEAFRITTDPITPPSAPSTQKHDPFFPSPAYLTVSSQLHLEAPTHALSRTYTLSPTFRAEPSATSRHLAEFYMLEAELAFVETLDDLMDTLETAIKDVLGGRRMTRARRDQEVIAKSLMEDKAETPSADEETDPVERSDMFGRISGSEPFGRVTYTEAVEILKERHAQTSFDFPPTWGAGLQSEHEKYLARQVYRGPVFVTDYPRNLKPFYMRLNPKDHLDRETVACFDLLVPGIGELAGGSLREERLDRLIESIDKANMQREDYEWYLDLRRFGSVKHGGWGMGFDRFMCWLTGIGNVRDVVAFPRWKGHCKY